VTRANLVPGIAISVLLGVGLAACGGSSSVAKPAAAAKPKGPHCATISPNPTGKGQPAIPQPGALTNQLVVKDVKVGTGPAAKAGSAVNVSYIGVSCTNGKLFDATYRDGGQPFQVAPLGQASVIPGWNKGLIGVKAGGVRELVIPPALGYGAAGSGPIPPNDTLVFLITVKSVTA
jgi:peptidylprolyl isomerase